MHIWRATSNLLFDLEFFIWHLWFSWQIYLFVSTKLSYTKCSMNNSINSHANSLAKISARSWLVSLFLSSSVIVNRPCDDLFCLRRSLNRHFYLNWSFLPRFCQDFLLARSWQDSGQKLAENPATNVPSSWQELGKILPRSCQKLRLEQLFQDHMRSWQDLAKVFFRKRYIYQRIINWSYF